MVIISGPSGSGKGTVVKRLDAAKGYARSISVTTRPPREGEDDGRDYFFTTPEEFTRMRQTGELLEHALFVGHNYGTPRRYVEQQIAEGKVVVLEIEINGALQVKGKFPDAVLIFLMPPTMDELSRRLNARATEDAVTIDARLKRASEEVPLISAYDYLVINDEVGCAVAKIDAIVDAERLRPRRCQSQINQFFI
ncbi:MAG: guanylate kinase [Defluviitaleaceae bacterium]|nr:guanylate kinase [Defluviitaleaceae bacterium]